MTRNRLCIYPRQQPTLCLRALVLPAILFLAAAVATPTPAQAPASASAGAPSLTGKWKIHIAIGGQEQNQQCSFVQTDKVLAGTCGSDHGEVKIAGSIDGNKASWKFDSEYQGTPITLTYTGAFDDKGKLSGSVDVAPFNVTGDFEVSPADAVAAATAAAAPATAAGAATTGATAAASASAPTTAQAVAISTASGATASLDG